MNIQAKYETDFYTKEWNRLTGEGKITFKHPEPFEYPLYKYDWYIIVALEKADKVKVDRRLLTGSLMMGYRNAIREGYQHQLDPSLRGPFDHPRNQNTINGMKGYIAKIFKDS